MRIRLGYVAMTMNLENCSPSGTVTLLNLNKIPEERARLLKLKSVTKKNLENTLRILKYNKAMSIMVYRLTSKLVPLATHPVTQDWDYISDFKSEFKEIGDFIKGNNFRISAHPDHFTILNSNNPKVHEDSIRDLDYHIKIFEAMGLPSDASKLVIHVGGVYKDKNTSLLRFAENFRSLPSRIRERIMIENDDKSFSAAEVICLCKELKVPMVLDLHHHQCVSNGENLENIILKAFSTWEVSALPPKVHFSSPKNIKDFRSHADNIDTDSFRNFLDAAKKAECDFDVMLEAKNKDSALLKLSNDIKAFGDLDWINNGQFELRNE